MTLRIEPVAPAPFGWRLTELGHALRALLAALLRLPRRRAGASSDDGLTYNNRNDGPPDLDELWRDFNKKLGGLFGGKGSGIPPQRGNGRDGGGGGNFQPDM